MIGLALFCLCCGCHAKRLKAVNDDIRADPEQRALVWDPSSAFIPSIARLPSTANSIGPAARQQHEEMSIATSPPDQKPPPVATDSEQQSIDVDALPLVRCIFDDYAAFFLDYFNSTFHLQTNQEIPKELLTAIGKKESKMANLVLGSTTAESPIRRLRITRVDAGLEVQALNAVIYPSPSYGALPILGVDIIYLNKGQRMLVGMDWAPVQPGPAYHAEHIAPFLEEFLRSLGNITTSPSGKMYGKLPEFFSESMFFSRPESVEDLRKGTAYWDAFVGYCERYMQKLVATPRGDSSSFGDGEKLLARQNEYDAWHAARDPAIPIFKRLFGKETSEELLKIVLFPGSAQRSAHHHE
jgi:hypothetical protein